MTSMIVRNEFLHALAESDRARLVESARSVELPSRFTFYEPGQLPRAIWFLNSGMASELVRLADGHTMDGSPVGLRGFVGVPAILDAYSSFHHCVMQVPGEALRVPVAVVKNLFDNSADFRGIAGRFIEARYVQATQSAACNLLHNMEQRLARWLLITRAHTASDEFHISQEYLSEMIGANRSTVTQTLGALERSGLIHLDRGAVKIASYQGLCKVTCECHCVIEEAFSRITACQPASRAAELT
ncbi:MAG TPA: Crp/Fnr family transcriptional regulator [Acidobacteriaceae bacterium]|nr:Crp/Fnr family transcriptional regulator [Acidobacteriaceae bacterium]